MSNLLSAIGTCIAYIIGGTAGSGADAVSITFANSWVGKFATAITGQPLFLVSVCLGLSLFGIHILRSLMGR